MTFKKINNIQDYQDWENAKEVYSENGITFNALNCVLVHKSMVITNDYNPNHVSKDKMKLLESSIKSNGFAFAIVCIFDPGLQKFVIVDGEHRNIICSESWLNLTYKPLVILKHNVAERMAATMQFNKARGVHSIEGNAELVKKLVAEGKKPADILKMLGMDAEEFLRLNRVSGIAEQYKNEDYSMSWVFEKGKE